MTKRSSGKQGNPDKPGRQRNQDFQQGTQQGEAGQQNQQDPSQQGRSGPGQQRREDGDSGQQHGSISSPGAANESGSMGSTRRDDANQGGSQR